MIDVATVPLRPMVSGVNAPVSSSLRHIDPRSVDAQVRAETRNREVHLPPISVYRWWARRTEAVNGAILDAVATERPGRLVVADIFAGGGVIALAAAIRKHRVYAQDINPWAAYGLHAMLNLPGAGTLADAAEIVRQRLQPLLDAAYGTVLSNGASATIAHTFRVATAACPECRTRLRLYPHAMVSLKRRKERGNTEAFIACRRGHLYEGRSDQRSRCSECGLMTNPSDAYTARRIVKCHCCGHASSLDVLSTSGTWEWEVVLVERAAGRHRELSLPTVVEVAQATTGWAPRRSLAKIPDGRETAVLRRHGFVFWHDIYPERQRHVLEQLLDEITAAEFNADVSESMRIAALGVAEMAGFASRWDRWYLKSYETMASHRFNFTTFTAEPNVWGTAASGRGTFRRRVALFEKAAKWLSERSGKLAVGRRSSTDHRRRFAEGLDVLVVEGSSERVVLPEGTVDLVLTDPPYHDDVQYGELSLPLRAWARLSTEDLKSEAVALEVDAEAYTGYHLLLTRIFSEARRILAPDGHLVFSYANREPDAWVTVLRSLHDAGFRAAGYTIVHSENEMDYAKRGVRACTMDLILDLVPASAEVLAWRPENVPDTAEASFLRLVGDVLINSVGVDADGWVGTFRTAATQHPFLAKSARS